MEEKKKKKSSAKTLQTAREAGNFGKKILSSAREAADAGRPVVWAMVDWWLGTTIAKAMGMEICYPENYGAFCAAMRKAEPYLDYAEGDGVPNTTCGYARNCIGYTRRLKENNFVIPEDAPGGGMPKPLFLLACGAACDARYKWFQGLGRYMDVPVWTLEFPQTGVLEYFMPGNKKDNINFMVQELRAFVSFLEKLLGKKMDWDNLEAKLDTFFKTHRLAYEVDILRKAVPSPAVNTDFWALMIPHLYMADDPEALEFYQRVYDEVKYKVDNKIGAVPNEKYRMIFSELPPWHTLGVFDEYAEKYGVAFAMESWNYHVPSPLPEEEKEKIHDPLELIATYSYHKFNEYAPVAMEHRMEPSLFTAPYLKYVKDYRIDGLFAHPLISCRPATYTLMHLRNLLMEKFKIPSVIVEGDIVDLRVFNEDESHAKMEAFIETMDHYREIRKKEGFEW
jgi:benzoyl-CoA reductase/2-hydroxyglutaryl-CoA dehydratase subunit BcrC/BadD/HgdB